MKEKDNFENLGIDGKITLKLILKKYDGRLRILAIGVRDQWQSVVSTRIDLWLL